MSNQPDTDALAIQLGRSLLNHVNSVIARADPKNPEAAAEMVITATTTTGNTLAVSAFIVLGEGINGQIRALLVESFESHSVERLKDWVQPKDPTVN